MTLLQTLPLSPRQCPIRSWPPSIFDSLDRRLWGPLNSLTGAQSRGSVMFVRQVVRRYDRPFVCPSLTFCYTTGYSKREVLGHNCRFLQSPTGNVAKGEPRRFASPEDVSYTRKLLPRPNDPTRL
jgi:hypothetical protein